MLGMLGIGNKPAAAAAAGAVQRSAGSATLVGRQPSQTGMVSRQASVTGTVHRVSANNLSLPGSALHTAPRQPSLTGNRNSQDGATGRRVSFTAHVSAKRLDVGAAAAPADASGAPSSGKEVWTPSMI